jgi:biopolymer transport protein ExbD
MADLDLHNTFRPGKKTPNQAIKRSTKVDLTPMVDLGFLLITFFFVSTTWSRPGSIPLHLPAQGPPTKVPATASLTIFPLHPNQVFYYWGEFQDALNRKQFGWTDYSVQAGIGQVIRNKQSLLDHDRSFLKGRKELVVMIKPGEETSLNNLVKILDEMAINQVARYVIMDRETREKQWLENRH